MAVERIDTSFIIFFFENFCLERQSSDHSCVWRDKVLIMHVSGSAPLLPELSLVLLLKSCIHKIYCDLAL